MAIYGFVRNSHLVGAEPPEVQIATMERKATELGESLTKAFLDRDASLKNDALLSSRTGREMLRTLQEGDTLIVTRLDRLGYTLRDVRKSVGVLCKRGMHICVLQGIDGELHLSPAHANIGLKLLALAAKTDTALRSERAAATRAYKQERGLWITHPSYGKKKVIGPDGKPCPEWDFEQLGYIAEIAERLGKGEDIARVAEDFWNRQIKDHRGLPWGKVQPKAGKGTGATYAHFHRATRWFHRAKHAGELPPPWNEIAATIPEPKGSTVGKRKKGWTPGGTARREQERAALKAQHRAERLARWQREKEARVRSRVHKPMLVRLKTARDA
jgi:DNA invertase Pin-like site-specific DNA recombinase